MVIPMALAAEKEVTAVKHLGERANGVFAVFCGDTGGWIRDPNPVWIAIAAAKKANPGLKVMMKFESWEDGGGGTWKGVSQFRIVDK
jgi:hypothetical protein